MAAERRPEDYEPQNPEPGYGRELTIMEHLNELRSRLFVMALAIAIGVVIGLIFSKPLISFLERPARQVDPGFVPVQIDSLEFLSVYFRIALLVGFSLALPVVLYEVLAFVVPGLTTKERKWLFPILFSGIVLFVIGGVFSYYLVVPRTLDFVLNFGKGQVRPDIRIGSYIDLISHLVFWVGLMFELPLMMMVPAAFGVITPKRYLKWWRYAVVLAFVCAAAVIPNINPLLQIMIAGPMIILYLLGVALAWLVSRGRRRAAA
jgi:sec-independent protein translocase protein TatC